MVTHKMKLESGKPSKTAEFMALFRALEFSYPKERRLFEDSLAVHFLSPFLRIVSYSSYIPVLQKIIIKFLDKNWAGARASGIARTRLIDDLLFSAIKKEMKQVIILGSGFDSRAYRIAEMKNLKVFEVDHPSTITKKKKKIIDIYGKIPEHVTYVETDFIHQSLGQTLKSAGFKPDCPTFIIWEGVTNYLTESAVKKTLKFISTLAKGTLLIFTYVHRDAIEFPEKYVEKRVSKVLQHQGELWTFGIRPNELSGLLQECGLHLIKDIDSVEYRRQYMYPVGPHMKGYEFYRAALAEVQIKEED